MHCVNSNIPDVISCTPNNTEGYVDGININISPFPIILKAGETVGIQFSFDVVKDIPVGSTVQIRLVKEGLMPTPLPCFPVKKMYFQNVYEIIYYNLKST